MKVFHTKADLQLWQSQIGTEKTVGLVPTMGALHEGHLSLIEQCKNECDVTVCSIYVNPTQFNDPTDFAKYPRDYSADIDILDGVNCDAVFLPSDEEMYPQAQVLKFDFGHLEDTMEGAHRPGHFNGVATVVSKLFHLVRPSKAFFGQKDFQQLAVIRQLVNDLSFQIQIVGCPTLRDADGLAMSSRNKRLSPGNRTIAPLLNQALQIAVVGVSDKKLDFKTAEKEAKAFLESHPNVELEYLTIVSATTLRAPLENTDELVVCIAAKIGGIRLIDNLLVTAVQAGESQISH